VNAPIIPANVRAVLRELGREDAALLGQGGEGYVFTFGDDTAVKIYHDADVPYLRSLQQLQAHVTERCLPFATPQILEIGTALGTHYTIEPRLTGMLMEEKFPAATADEKYALLRSYHDAITVLHGIEFPDLPYGSLVEIEPRITDVTWHGFLVRTLDYKVGLSRERLSRDVAELDGKVQLLSAVMTKVLSSVGRRSLVHADYFVNQVLVNEANEVSAVMDISCHAVAGDPRLDDAGTFFFEGMKGYAQEHIDFLLDLTVRDHGEAILRTNDIYRMYYCFYFSFVHDIMPDWYRTLISNLNDEDIWERLRGYLTS